MSIVARAIAGRRWVSTAVLEIRAATGGKDANEFAARLRDMYLAAQGGNLVERGRGPPVRIDTAEVVAESACPEGVRSARVSLTGTDGLAECLRMSEHGVHRIVRVSPFAKKKKGSKRHTALATVAVHDAGPPCAKKGGKGAGSRSFGRGGPDGAEPAPIAVDSGEGGARGDTLEVGDDASALLGVAGGAGKAWTRLKKKKARRAARLDAQDLRVDTFRAAKNGGQSVNTTDSAVRITHLPTGIAVRCQDERSQHMNKKAALKLLAERVAAHADAEHAERSREVSRSVGSGSMGDGEIARSYVLFPTELVKDRRTGAEVSVVSDVLDAGGIAPFVQAAALRGIDEEE